MAVMFSFGLMSGLGWFISVPVLRHASLASVLRSRFVSCERYAGADFFEGTPRQRCYFKEVVGMVRSYGIASTISALRSYMRTSNGSYLQGMRCHALAHEIGNAAARFGTPSDVLMTQCIGLCDFGDGREPIDGIDLGCMNGAGHTWVLMSQNVTEASAKCSTPSIPEPARMGCYHGIGHGLREKNGNDFQRAVSECLVMPNDEARYQCAHAIFMEPMQNSEISITPEKLLAYCASLSGKVELSCFEFIGFTQYGLTNQAIHAFDICDASPLDARTKCRSRVGEAIYNRHHKIEDISQCDQLPDIHAPECTTGFIRTIIDNVNDTYGKRALAACSMLTSSLQEHCYRVTGEFLFLRFGDFVRKQACQTVSGVASKHACMTSIAQ